MDLEPPSLETVASWIHDEQWIDMRICGKGMFERVLPFAVTIHRNLDELHCRQDYQLDGIVTQAYHDFDCEDIMWWRPTICGLEDVEPRELSKVRQEVSDEYLAGEILETVAFMSGHGIQTIKDSGTCSHERQVCIRLMWEASDLGAGKIPELFGYASGGMFTSAMRMTAKDKNRVDEIKRAYALLETRVGHRLPFVRSAHRRSQQSPVAAVVPTA